MTLISLFTAFNIPKLCSNKLNGVSYSINRRTVVNFSTQGQG